MSCDGLVRKTHNKAFKLPVYFWCFLYRIAQKAPKINRQLNFNVMCFGIVR